MIQRGALLVFLILFSLTIYSQSWSAGLDLISMGKWFGSAREGVFIMVQKQGNERFSWRADLGLDYQGNFRDWDYFNAAREVRIVNNGYHQNKLNVNLKIGPMFNSKKTAPRFNFYLFPSLQFKHIKDNKRFSLKYQLWAGTKQEDIYAIPFDEHEIVKTNLGLDITFGLSIKLGKNIYVLIENGCAGSIYFGTQEFIETDWIIDWSNPNVSRPVYFDESYYYNDKGFEVAYYFLNRIFIRYTF